MRCTTILVDELRPGVELLHMRGPAGYGDEEIIVSNSLSNGLRIEVTGDDVDWAPFHIKDAQTARIIATKLLAWCERIADPPECPGNDSD